MRHFEYTDSLRTIVKAVLERFEALHAEPRTPDAENAANRAAFLPEVEQYGAQLENQGPQIRHVHEPIQQALMEWARGAEPKTEVLHPISELRIWLREYEEKRAAHSATPQPDRSPSRVVIGLHGIRTRAIWQRYFAQVAQNSGLQPRTGRWDFGWFSALRLLLPWARQKKLKWFRDTYQVEIGDRDVKLAEREAPSVVAHSFGTFILGYALKRFKYLRVDRVVLCGSILPTGFDWQLLFKRGQIRGLRVEYGVRDVWVKLGGWFVRGAGPSGAYGFEAQGLEIEQEKFDYAHSEYFADGHMRAHWLPFLLGKEIPMQQHSPVKTGPKRPWLAYLLLLVLLAGLTLATPKGLRRLQALIAGPGAPAAQAITDGDLLALGRVKPIYELYMVGRDTIWNQHFEDQVRWSESQPKDLPQTAVGFLGRELRESLFPWLLAEATGEEMPRQYGNLWISSKLWNLHLWVEDSGEVRSMYNLLQRVKDVEVIQSTDPGGLAIRFTLSADYSALSIWKDFQRTRDDGRPAIRIATTSASSTPLSAVRWGDLQIQQLRAYLSDEIVAWAPLEGPTRKTSEDGVTFEWAYAETPTLVARGVPAYARR